MQWLNLDMTVLENVDFACAETEELGTWLRLMRYCCVHENRGRIRGAKKWEERHWNFLFRLKKSDLDRKSSLWEWSGDDLIVHYFPKEKLRQVERLRAQSAKANEIRWGKAAANRDATGMPKAIPHGIPNGTPDSAPGTPELEGEREGNRNRKENRKEKGKRGHLSQVGSHPSTMAEVVEFFAQEGTPAEVAEDFFHHFEANGWTQGGRPGCPLAAWQPEGLKWIARYRREQKSSGGGGAAAFNPATPHAFTGGIPVAN